MSMRRTVARGRVFPQFYSTDRRYGRLSVKAVALFPLMWVNADDQGRLSGDPEEIKYAACPNIDHLAKADIPALLEELAQNQLIKAYNTTATKAIQLLDWWEVPRQQWAWPSRYPPPPGWQDHLRYKKSAKEVVTLNWPVSGETQNGTQVSDDSPSGKTQNGTQVSDDSPSGKTQKSGQVSHQVSDDSPSGEPSGETSEKAPLTTPLIKITGEGRRRGRSPEPSGEKPSPSPPGDPDLENKIHQRLTECFRREWGRVPAESYPSLEVIPREPTARDKARLRDLAKEISAAGGCELDTIDQAFREAAGQTKFSISYVRAILLDWLGIARNRSP